MAENVQFTNTITLGALIISVFVGIGTLGVFGYGAKWKAAATSESAALGAMEEERNVYRDKAERLQTDNAEQRELKHKALTELEGERLKTDFTPALKAIVEMQQTLAGRAEIFDEIRRALQDLQGSSVAQTNVLNSIATRLNGGTK